MAGLKLLIFVQHLNRRINNRIEGSGMIVACAVERALGSMMLYREICCELEICCPSSSPGGALPPPPPPPFCIGTGFQTISYLIGIPNPCFSPNPIGSCLANQHFMTSPKLACFARINHIQISISQASIPCEKHRKKTGKYGAAIFSLRKVYIPL